MTVRLTPIMTMAPQYGSLVGWSGDLVVHTVHALNGKKSYRIHAEDTVDLTEVGVMLSWPSPEPTGMFVPYGEVIGIEQVVPGTEE